jgi:hypothetical protein
MASTTETDIELWKLATADVGYNFEARCVKGNIGCRMLGTVVLNSCLITRSSASAMKDYIDAVYRLQGIP